MFLLMYIFNNFLNANRKSNGYTDRVSSKMNTLDCIVIRSQIKKVEKDTGLHSVFSFKYDK